MACSHTDRFLNKVNQARLGLEEGVPYLNSGVLMDKTGGKTEPVQAGLTTRFFCECFTRGAG